MNQSISNKRLRLSCSSPGNPQSPYSSNSKASTSSTHSLNFQNCKKNLHRQQPSTEVAASNEAELDAIDSFEIKPYLTEKVKQFQAACIKNHFSEWVSYTMGKEILGSVSGLSLEFSDRNENENFL